MNAASLLVAGGSQLLLAWLLWFNFTRNAAKLEERRRDRAEAWLREQRWKWGGR